MLGAEPVQQREHRVQLRRRHVVLQQGEEVVLLILVVVRPGGVEVAHHVGRGDPRLGIVAPGGDVGGEALDQVAVAQDALVAPVEDVDGVVEIGGRGREEEAHGGILPLDMGANLRRINPVAGLVHEAMGDGVADELGLRAHVHLLQDVGLVGADGLDREVEPPGDVRDRDGHRRSCGRSGTPGRRAPCAVGPSHRASRPGRAAAPPPR
jgi:hypothetical protein